MYKIKYTINGDPIPRKRKTTKRILNPVTFKPNFSDNHEQTPKIFLSVYIILFLIKFYLPF